MKVPLYRHNLHGHDIDALGEEFKSLLRGMMLTTGNVCKDMQEKFAKYMGIEHCLLTNNWTSAMIATLMSLDIGPGDEVIIPSLTFVATANAIEAVGARPVLVDIDPKTKLMDIAEVTSKITAKTKAVVPVHLYGQMVDMLALRAALPADVIILEDSAHCIEGRRDGYAPGKHSKAAMFSFYNSKNMTTGEGGAMITDHGDLLATFTTVYRHGIDLDGFKRHTSKQFIEPESITAGIKGNMPDILAFLLRPQIDDLPLSHARRTANAMRYIEALSDLDLEIPSVDVGVTHAWHTFAIGVDAAKRSEVLARLDDMGIRTTIHYKPVHQMRYFVEKYGYRQDEFINSSSWGQRTLSLPVFSDMTLIEQNYVIDNLRKIMLDV
jgi:UDP-4-amino-4-deoxy-L-arabinose-oxoglutarate aminotransferase